jgi:hypothetical protein
MLTACRRDLPEYRDGTVDFKPADTPPSLPSVEQPTTHARPLVSDAGASAKPL